MLFLHLIGAAQQGFVKAQVPSTQPDLSETDLNRLENELEDPSKRLPAIATLARFASMKLYMIPSLYVIDSDARRNALRDRAVLLTRKHHEIETVSGALDSTDSTLNLWGLMFWRGGIQRARDAAERRRQEQPTEDATEEIRVLELTNLHSEMVRPLRKITDEEQSWLTLMPKIRHLAKENPYRLQAIEDVAYGGPDDHEFLKGLVATETDAGVLLHLLDITDNANRDVRFNDEFIRLLSDPDIKVRTTTMAEIGFNWNNAEMWQVRFTPKVRQRVLELSLSIDPEEKRLADWAVVGLDKISAIWLERDQNKPN